MGLAQLTSVCCSAFGRPILAVSWRIQRATMMERIITRRASITKHIFPTSVRSQEAFPLRPHQSYQAPSTTTSTKIPWRIMWSLRIRTLIRWTSNITRRCKGTPTKCQKYSSIPASTTRTTAMLWCRICSFLRSQIYLITQRMRRLLTWIRCYTARRSEARTAMKSSLETWRIKCSRTTSAPMVVKWASTICRLFRR